MMMIMMMIMNDILLIG